LALHHAGLEEPTRRTIPEARNLRKELGDRPRGLSPSRSRWSEAYLLKLLFLAFVLQSGYAQQNAAALRITHLSPDAPLIDILIDGQPAFRDVAFGTNTGYLFLTQGEHEITMYPHRHPRQPTPIPQPAVTAQATTEDSAAEEPVPARPRVQPLEPITTLVTLETGGYYTVALVGFFEPPPEEGRLGNLTIQVSPEGSEITVTGPRGYLARPESDVNLANLEPGPYLIRVTHPGYQSARYEAEVLAGLGTAVSITLQRGEDPAEDIVADPEEIMEASRQEQLDQLVWHRTELQLYHDDIPGFPAAGLTLLRVVHASPITSGIDARAVWVAGNAVAGEEQHLVADLTFPNNSPYESVPAGRYHLRFYASGTDYLIAELPDYVLEPGVIYSLYVVGNVDDDYLRLLARIDGAVHRRPP
jgi:hypothetical protein